MISVIVITRNEEFNIIRTLDALKDHRISEIIVVDSRSTDNTCELVRNYQRNDKRVNLISLEGNKFTAARGRQAGIEALNIKSKYCLFIDGDMELHADFLQKAEVVLDTLAIGGLTGQRTDYLYDSEYKVIGKREKFYDTNKEMFLGGAFIVKTELLLKYGKFDVYFPVLEETFFYQRFKEQGITFIRIPDHMFIHHMLDPDTRAHLFKRLLDRKLQAFGIILYHLNQDQVPIFIKKIMNQIKVALLIISVLLFYFIQGNLPVALFILIFGAILLGNSPGFMIRSLMYLSLIPVGFISEAIRRQKKN